MESKVLEIFILFVGQKSVFDKELKEYFDKMKYKYAVVESAHEAMKYIYNKSIEIDLAVVSEKLHDTNGISFISQIKNVRSELPVLLKSKQVGPKIAYAARKNGAVGCIQSGDTEKNIIHIAKYIEPLQIKKERIIFNEQILSNSKLIALGELAATIVHDIKGPLSIIKEVCNEIKEEILSNKKIEENELQTFVKDIEKSSNKISSLIEHLKSFSRQESTSTESYVNLNYLLDNSMFFVSNKIKKMSISIEKKIANDLINAEIKCQESKFEQVIINLISNSCDAMKESAEKKLTIEAYHDSEKLIIKISDTGAGIPDEIKTKIFESFFTTKPKNQGTGLGLSIVKNIVKEHDGILLFDTKVGTGTSFYIQIPIERLMLKNQAA